jgi:hypothetical protein
MIKITIIELKLTLNNMTPLIEELAEWTTMKVILKKTSTLMRKTKMKINHKKKKVKIMKTPKSKTKQKLKTKRLNKK